MLLNTNTIALNYDGLKYIEHVTPKNVRSEPVHL